MNEEQKIGHIYIPAHIMDRNDLTLVEKVLYGKIIGLTEKKGYCYSTNEWLAHQIGLSYSGVSNSISKFVRLELIKREIIRNEKKEIIQRKLFPFVIGITSTSERGITSTSEGIQDKLYPRKTIVSTNVDTVKHPSENIAKEHNAQDVLKEFTKQFESKFGSKPMYNFGRDGKLAKELLKVYSLDKLEQLMHLFFFQGTDFTDIAGFSFNIFYTQINKLIADQPEPFYTPEEQKAVDEAEEMMKKMGKL